MHFLVLLSALVACAAGVPFNTTISALGGCIVREKPARIEHYPHQVAILYRGSAICGGSIISRNYVITAANCFAGVNTNYLRVTAGSTYNNVVEPIEQVIRGHIHPLYNPSNWDYNVAVLEVQPPFTYSDRVRNISLEDSEVPDGTSVVVTGWGTTRPEPPANPRLLEAVVEISERGKCRKSVSGEFTDRMICAGNPCGCKGPWNEDRGGPLTTIYCPPTLVGIVSYGPRNCGRTVYPAVYTKISAVREWIIQYI